MAWTTPEDIAARVLRLWNRGAILSAPLEGEVLFPLRLTVTRPDSRAMGERFEVVREWIRRLEDANRTHLGFGYDVQWMDIDHRQLGRNPVPEAVVIPTEADALQLIGMRGRAERFRALVGPTLETFPELRPWIARRPLTLLEHEHAWERVVRVLAWFCDHPRPGLYARQLEVPGVDTKFIEERRGLFSELLDCVLPSAAIDADARGARAFEQRYGLRSKPPLVRFRALDLSCTVGGLTDISTPAAEFAALSLPVRRVFFTENDVNGLSFPEVPDAIVIFGLGYGLDRLAGVEWLRRTIIHYWGDIDTHGFAILDRLRAILPEVHSLMMDRETLLAHRSQWVEESARHVGGLARLTAAEVALYDDLSADRLGDRVRLEQERVSFTWLKERLRSFA